MTTLIPTASACHTLQLPPTEKDDRLNLNVRTGSASTLYNSLVFTYGGLTIGLELYELTIEELFNTFQSKIIHSNSKFKNISKFLSGELFYLSLIDRCWTRVSFDKSDDFADAPIERPCPRLFHEVTCVNNCLYLFGGLTLPDYQTSGTEGSTGSYLKNFLVPINDLWEFNLESSRWTLLHDGKGYKNDPAIPIPRFCHKLTVINRLTCVNRKDHFGIFIAGGRDEYSRPIYDNVIFDLVDKKYVGSAPVELKVAPTLPAKKNIGNCEDDKLNINYIDSIVVTFPHEDHHHYQVIDSKDKRKKKHDYHKSEGKDESLIVYTPTKSFRQDQIDNPLLSFRIGKSIKSGKTLPIHRKKILKLQNEPDQASGSRKKYVNRQALKQTVPFNLRYPIGGLFGQNVVITGFLPNDYDISIFIYNQPTGKWSRLNIFCNHNYGSHRFWGGFAWQSHHKVVLLGNYMTSRTTSSVRFFTSMITVSLPVTNILASSELAGGHHHGPDGRRIYHDKSRESAKQSDQSFNPLDPKGKTNDGSTDDSTCSSLLVEKDGDDEDIDSSSNRSPSSRDDLGASDEDISTRPASSVLSPRKLSQQSNNSDKTSPTTISFTEYVHYAAPKTNFTKIRSVFPPAAITLGRNAFDRYGELISDFEMVSSNGDRIPVSMTVLLERWGRYFIQILARSYVQAVDRFDSEQSRCGDVFDKSRVSKSDSNSSSTHSALQSLSNISDKKGARVDRNKASIGTISSTSSDGSESSKPNEDTSSSPTQKHTYYTSSPSSGSKSKDPPLFRLPFQDNASNNSFSSSKKDVSGDDNSVKNNDQEDKSRSGSIIRKDSMSSATSNNSLLTSHLQDIPPQLPLPSEQIPSVPCTPVSFRQSSSRKNSGEFSSPRASLINTLTQLRNIPTRDSPFSSPRASLSTQGGVVGGATDLYGSTVPDLRPVKTSPGTVQRNPFELEGSKVSSESNAELKKAKTPIGDSETKASSDSDSDFKLSDPSESSNSSISTPKAPHSHTFASISSVDSDKNRLLTSIRPDTPSNASSGKDSNEEDENTTYDDDNAAHNFPQMQRRGLFDNALLNFDNIQSSKFQMEPSLIPRKLYMPFSTVTIRAFCEYLYTGQVGNKWLLTSTALDNLAISKFFKVPLLYDLISEVLFGIIGRKESYIIKEGNKLKKSYFNYLDATGTPADPDFKFPLDVYEGFMNTVDDGYLDLVLLKKSSNLRIASVNSISSSKKKSLAGSSSYSQIETEITENEEPEEEVQSEATHKPQTKEDTNSTDDSSDKKTTTSNSEEEIELGFLDVQEPSIPMPSMHPRQYSKQYYDKVSQGFGSDPNLESGKEESDIDEKDKIAMLTLEQLVSPDSEVPPDSIIDHIYESAAIVVDMKLMLRASNVREMSRILTQSKLDVGKLIEGLKQKYEQQKASAADKKENEASENEHRPSLKQNPSQSSSGSIGTYGKESINVSGESKGSISSQGSAQLSHRASTASSIKPSLSNSSLANGGSQSSISKGLRGLGGFTPFKQHKTDPRLGNKELDKRITSMIKKDEKMKTKNERERKESERLEKIQLSKAAKKKDKGHDAYSEKEKKHHKPTFLSRTSSKLNLSDVAPLSLNLSHRSDSDSITKKKTHHSFFHLGKKSDSHSKESSIEPERPNLSSNASLNSSTSKSGKKKLFGLKKTSS